MNTRYGRLLILIVLLAVIGGGAALYHKQQTPKISCLNCNVIIVGYDTVGASHVSSLGYQRQTTLQLDKMAQQGVSFTNNISPAPWTVPSFMSLFTGLYPSQHK